MWQGHDVAIVPLDNIIRCLLPHLESRPRVSSGAGNRALAGQLALAAILASPTPCQSHATPKPSNIGYPARICWSTCAALFCLSSSRALAVPVRPPYSQNITKSSFLEGLTGATSQFPPSRPSRISSSRVCAPVFPPSLFSSIFASSRDHLQLILIQVPPTPLYRPGFVGTLSTEFPLQCLPFLLIKPSTRSPIENSSCSSTQKTRGVPSRAISNLDPNRLDLRCDCPDIY